MLWNVSVRGKWVLSTDVSFVPVAGMYIKTMDGDLWLIRSVTYDLDLDRVEIDADNIAPLKEQEEE